MTESKQHNWITDTWAFLRGAVPEVYRGQFLRSRTQTNVRRMWVLSLFIICVQVALNLIRLVSPRSVMGGGDLRIAILSLLTLGLGVLFFLLSAAAQRGVLKNERLLRLLPFALLYAYIGIQLLFFSLHIQLGAGDDGLVIAMLVAGLFLVIPPLQTILTLGALFLLRHGILLYHQHTGGGLALTDGWANTVIIAVLIIYIACIIYDVYLRNFLNQTRLEGSNRQLERIAQTDSLTEILNRRGFFKTVDRDWAEYIAHSPIVAVCMFDIDFFKKFNDQHGHLLGDECLRIVAQRLQRFFEQVDGGIVCRFGGEEFLAIFRGTDGESVLDTAWQACRAIRRAEVPNPAGVAPLQVTISGGLAYGDGEGGCDALIRLADEALYHAKAEGRDRICLSERCGDVPVSPEQA